MLVTSHTGKGNDPKLLGIIPMAGTKQITLRAAAHSKLREVMSKRNGLREPTRWLRALKYAQGYARSGDGCNRIKSKLSSGPHSTRKFSSTLAKCLFWGVRHKELKTSSRNGRMAFTTSRVAGSVWAIAGVLCRQSFAPFLIGNYEN